MDINDVFSNSKQLVPKLTRHRDVVIGIQRTIQEINNKHRGIRDTKKIITAVEAFTGTFTFAAAGKTINDDDAGDFEATYGLSAGDKIWFSGDGALNTTEMTIVSIQNDAATNDQITVSETIVNDSSIDGTLAGFTILSGYSYNHLTGVISMPTTVKEVSEIFSEQKELDVLDYDDLIDGLRVETYTPLGDRKFQISDDLLGTDIEVMGWYDITNITASTRATTIDVLTDYEPLIYSGVIYYLTSIPSLKDEDLNGTYKDMFYSALGALAKEQEIRFHTPQRDARKYY